MWLKAGAAPVPALAAAEGVRKAVFSWDPGRRFGGCLVFTAVGALPSSTGDGSAKPAGGSGVSEGSTCAMIAFERSGEKALKTCSSSRGVLRGVVRQPPWPRLET